MVVVLPEPLTPTTSTTNGLRARPIASGFATGAKNFLDFGGERPP